MIATPPSIAPPDATILEKNLAELRTSQPDVAARLSEARAPRSWSITHGRDGAPTYSWTDDTGVLHWLGRTTMPTVRAEALIEAFQPGDGNILLAGFGQGAEAELLFGRLAPHQAVMAVEECAWAAACVLRLHDFSREIRDGRLLLFAGASAWEDYEGFLDEHDGYLEPQRILSWPWFEAPQIAEVTQRLTAMNARLFAQRAAGMAECLSRKHVTQSSTESPKLAILSSLSDPRIRRAAQVLSIAAQSLGWKVESFVLDQPSRVHPLGVRRTLGEFSPTLCLLLDIAPSMLPYPLPESAIFILCAHGDPPLKEWPTGMEPAIRLGVVNERQRRQALEAGVSSEKILIVHPAAQNALNGGHSGDPARAARLIAIADRIDPSPEAAGLHLASHRRLWQAATTNLGSRCDAYHDGQAEEVLAAAEKETKITLTSDDVRTGLVERIRRRLGPAIVRLKFLESLDANSIEFDLYGAGWEIDPKLAPHHCGPWPAPRDLKGTLSRYHTMIVLDPVIGPFGPLLDGLAAGLRCLHRSLGETPPPLTEWDPSPFAFSSRADLLRLLKNGTESEDRALHFAKIINDQHTWAHRLESIARFCQLG